MVAVPIKIRFECPFCGYENEIDSEFDTCEHYVDVKIDDMMAFFEKEASQ